MTVRRYRLPRIFQIHARHLGAVRTNEHLAPAWQAAVALAADMGFAQLLIGANDESPEALGALAEACRARDLELWADVSLGEVAVGTQVAQELPDYYPPGRRGDDALDPRRPAAAPGRARLAWKRDDDTAWAAYWSARLAALADAGVSGFNFLLPQHVPLAAWRALFAHDAGFAHCRRLAWTPGVPRDALPGLREVGFDVVFGSLAWWDFRSPWLWAEQHVLDTVGQVAAFPESPYELTGVHAYGDPALRGRAARRALWAAATLGHGWLVPMGFEQGAPVIADPVDVAQAARVTPDAQLDLADDLRAANRWIAALPDTRGEVRTLSGVDAAATVAWRRQPPTDDGNSPSAQWLVFVNPDLHLAADIDWAAISARVPGEAQRFGGQASSAGAQAPGAGAAGLEPGEVRVVMLEIAPPIAPLAKVTRPVLKRQVTAALAAPRVAIENISPMVDGGRFALKRTPGQAVVAEADVFMDGHDKLAVDLLWRPADSRQWTRVPMSAVGNDRWQGSFVPDRVGLHCYAIEAWRDTFATYRDELSKKRAAGIDVSVELDEVRNWVAPVLAKGQKNADDEAVRRDAGAALEQLNAFTHSALLEWILSDAGAAAVAAVDPRQFASRSAEFTVNVERRAAEFASWYELFPRSQSGDPERHGNFDDVIARLPAIRDMGFDVLYFPPIHPIGVKNRKGRNNSLSAGPADPGSPYAIGAAEGGHDAIHPELGTLEDFRRLVAAAHAHGLEIALDFAIQCSPDHPWLRDHPEWFAWRADGSLRYAENPPKKYEDIVNVDFYAGVEKGPDDASGLWNALRDAVLFWAREGVRTFRVDNPHTKPLPFWEWMIGQVQGRYPDAVFLSEAFTRPKMMYRLAKLGFSQSYTYFTWREHKQELGEYLTEVSNPPVADFFRPNFFVNTPDINPRFLQASGRAGFLIRAALATTGSGLWGMYSGFELCEAAAVPGKEEYLDSEKYEIRAWDWHRPGNIVAEISQLNRIRRDNPALQSHRGLTLANTDNGAVLAFVRATPQRDNVVLVVVSLDPFSAQGATVELPLWEFGQPDHGALQVEDLLRGTRFTCHGKLQHVWLEPGGPYAIWRLSLHA